MLLRRYQTVGATLLLVGLALVLLFSSHAAQARHPQADFAAPLSYREAQAIVAAAQAREAQLRTVVNQPLGSINPELLPQMQTIYFPQTGHHLSNRSGFLDFWRINGQVQVFGYPLTEELVEAGRIVQYFERARFELHAEHIGTPQQVQLGLLGRELLEQQGLPPRMDDQQTGGRYFAETGHTLWGKFRNFWERRDGMQLYGMPLSAVVEEDGRSVQYFERAKFVYFPEELPAVFRTLQNSYGYSLNALYEVQLSDLGRLLAEQRGFKLAPVPQLLGTHTWHPALWERRVEISIGEQWLSAYEGDLLVFRAPVATGRDGFNTPVGDYAVYYKTPMQTMSGCMAGECWNVPHVPWAQYIVGGVALHGTYWHNNHGTGIRPSHGCINLRIEDAQWLYEWTSLGTPVQVRY